MHKYKRVFSMNWNSYIFLSIIVLILSVVQIILPENIQTLTY